MSDNESGNGLVGDDNEDDDGDDEDARTSTTVSAEDEENEEWDGQYDCDMLLPLKGEDRAKLIQLLRLFEASKDSLMTRMTPKAWEEGILAFVDIADGTE